jgi:putative selenate reductase molybdopterin-binding subunit
MNIEFTLNNKKFVDDIVPGQTLFEYLRENGIFSVKYGSDKGECGADTVLVNGKAQNSSLMLMHTVNNCVIETIESFKDNESLQKFQESFLNEGAVQSGYNTPGMLLAIEALHRENEYPTEADIRDTLSGVLCRETGYVKPVKAAKI